MWLCVLFPMRLFAAPAPGSLRLSFHGQVSNAYLIDSSRFNRFDDIFTIALAELDELGTTSSANLTAVGAFLQLEYVLHEHIALGLRTGVSSTFSGAFAPSDLRIPLVVTARLPLWGWLAVQPEVGMTVTYNPRTTLAGANLNAGLRLRIVDTVDLHAAFIHGVITGFQFSAAVRFFDIFSIPLVDSSP